jgi:hypothetical protein
LFLPKFLGSETRQQDRFFVELRNVVRQDLFLLTQRLGRGELIELGVNFRKGWGIRAMDRLSMGAGPSSMTLVGSSGSSHYFRLYRTLQSRRMFRRDRWLTRSPNQSHHD